MTILGLFALAALLLLVALFPTGLRRRRKKKDEEFQIVYERPKPSLWVLLVMLVAALLPLAVAGYLLWFGWRAPDHVGGLVSSGMPPRPDLLPQGLAVPSAQEPLFTGAVALLGLAAGLACVGLVLWILLGDRILGRWEGLFSQLHAAQQLIGVVEESLDSFRQDPDARRAIIRCYRRFEGVLAGSGVPRAPWETPAEFMHTALSRLRLPGKAVGILTELFEVSRFSHHPVGSGERDAAVSSLIEIKADLEREVSDAPDA